MRDLKILTTMSLSALLSACGGSDNSSGLIEALNFPPSVSTASQSIQLIENQNSTFSVDVSDPDGDVLVYSLSGEDAGQFMINSATGIVEFISAPDFEMPVDHDMNNIYNITVSASDGEFEVSSDISIEVQDDPTDNADTFASCIDYVHTNGATFPNTLDCTVTKDDSGREFLVYLPEAYEDRTSSVPMLFSLHGYGSAAILNYSYTGFQAIADVEGFPVIYPKGSILETTGRAHWNVGGFSAGSKADDEGFIDTILEYMAAVYDIDRSRIYSTGMSNGGYMSYLLACGSADKFAAIGSVTGSMTFDMEETCSPSRPISTMQIHGKLDPTVEVDGDLNSLAIADVIEFWADANNCDTTPVTSVIADLDDDDEEGGTLFEYGNCDNDVAVEYYLLDALKHQWPIRNGRFNFDIHAADVVWGFVSGYNLDGPIE